MIGLLAAPLVIGLLAAPVVPALCRRLPPRTAATVLAVLGPLVALGSVAALALAGMFALTALPFVAAYGGWSGPGLARSSGLPLPVCWAAGLIAAGLLIRVAVTATRFAVGWRRSVRRVAAMTHGADLCVIEDEQPEAFVVPGLRRGRIIVTSAMLGALSPAERRALLAHERCHLRHRHHLYACAVAFSAAADPFLARWPALLRSALERWADESAAEVAGRGSAVTGLARAALARQRPGRTDSGTPTRLATPDPAIGFGAADHQVVERVRCLQRGPTPARPLLTALAATLALACTTVVTAAAISANDRVQTAESRYAATSPVQR